MPRVANKSAPSFKDFTFSGTAVWDAVARIGVTDRELAYQRGEEAVKNKIEYALTQISLEAPKNEAHKQGTMDTVKAIREVLASIK